MTTPKRAGTGKSIKLGIVGNGRIAERFVKEARHVSGVEVAGVFGRSPASLENFACRNKLVFFSLDYPGFLQKVDAVYVATPPLTHYHYAKTAVESGRHVLCEKPLTLSAAEAKDLFASARERNVVLLEAIKTAFAPGFIDLMETAVSGAIGEIKDVDAVFTKLVKSGIRSEAGMSIGEYRPTTGETVAGAFPEEGVSPGYIRELDVDAAGGSVTELASYPLLAIIKLLGENPEQVDFFSFFEGEQGVDVFTRINLVYKDAVAAAKVGLGVKAEGALVMAGTQGYIYVPAPWWKPVSYEVRYEDPQCNRKFFFPFEGDGLRYELEEFIARIHDGNIRNRYLSPSESVAIAGIIERFLLADNTRRNLKGMESRERSNENLTEDSRIHGITLGRAKFFD